MGKFFIFENSSVGFIDWMKYICLLWFSLVVAPVYVCRWDRDTLKKELAGVPEMEEVIFGAFPRNPPQYYEMRIKIGRSELSRDPEQWDRYDDIAVAYDRLGDPTSALEWMDQKEQAMATAGFDASAGPQPNHGYRTMANRGTFYVHRWIQSPHRNKDLEDLQLRREWIAKAIALNPNAHFDREIYQLKAIETLLEWMEQTDTPYEETGGDYLPNLLQIDPVQKRVSPIKEA